MDSNPKRLNAGLWALLAKIGFKILPLAGKMLKGAKSLKFGMGAASLGAYSLFLSWEFAILIMLTILIHESGHVWAMRKIGMKTKGFYFVPLLGGAAVPDEAFPSRGAEAWVAIWGPVWGGLMIIPCYVVYMSTNNALWLGIIGWIAMVNAFNLLPVLPLDGGRMLRSIAFSLSSRIGFIVVTICLLLGTIIIWKIGFALVFFLLILGTMEIGVELANIRAFNRTRARIEKFKIYYPYIDTDTILQVLMDDDRNPHIIKFDMVNKLVTKSTGSWIWDPTYQEMEDITKARSYYKLAKRQMNSGVILAAAGSYLGVSTLLLLTMYTVSHVPGAKEAFEFFRN